MNIYAMVFTDFLQCATEMLYAFFNLHVQPRLVVAIAKRPM